MKYISQCITLLCILETLYFVIYIPSMLNMFVLLGIILAALIAVFTFEDVSIMDKNDVICNEVLITISGLIYIAIFTTISLCNFISIPSFNKLKFVGAPCLMILFYLMNYMHKEIYLFKKVYNNEEKLK